MKNLTVVLLMFLPLAVWAADLYKCKGVNGKITYSDKACVVGEPDEGRITVRDTKPSDEALQKLKQMRSVQEDQKKGGVEEPKTGVGEGQKKEDGATAKPAERE